MRRLRSLHDDRVMSSIVAPTVSPTPTWNHRRYWIVTGLFCAIFVVSAALTFLDPSGTREATAELGFPAYIGTYPLALAKLAAVFVILSRRWPTLRMFAFAGLLFDIVLALSAHIYEGDFPYGWLAVFALVMWCAAFAVDRERTAAESRV